MDAALVSAYSQPILLEVFLVRIAFPNGTLRLMSSSGEITYNSEVYYGNDIDGWGEIIAVGSINEGLDNQIPSCQVTLAPTTALKTTALLPNFQNSQVDIWRGLRNPDGGALIGVEPLLLSGWVTTINRKISGQSQVFDVHCVGHQEARFNAQGGAYYDTNFDKLIDPTDKFNEFGAGSVSVSPANVNINNTNNGFYRSNPQAAQIV